MKIFGYSILSLLILTVSCVGLEGKRIAWPDGWSSQAVLQGVNLSARALPRNETRKIFGGRGKRLLRKRILICPIELTVSNTSSKDVDVAVNKLLEDAQAKGLLPELVDVSKIINKTSKSLPRALLFGLAGAVGVAGFGITLCFSVGIAIACMLPLTTDFYTLIITFYTLSAVGILAGSSAAGVAIGSKCYGAAKSYETFPENRVITLQPGQQINLLLFASAASLA